MVGIVPVAEPLEEPGKKEYEEMFRKFVEKIEDELHWWKIKCGWKGTITAHSLLGIN